MPLFIVNFRRVGKHRWPAPGWRVPMKAPDMLALEKPIKEAIQDYFSIETDVSVTINEELKEGQLNYGMLGTFTIIPPEIE